LAVKVAIIVAACN